MDESYGVDYSTRLVSVKVRCRCPNRSQGGRKLAVEMTTNGRDDLNTKMIVEWRLNSRKQRRTESEMEKRCLQWLIDD